MAVLLYLALLSLPALAAPFYSIQAVGPENGVATGIGSNGSVSGYWTDPQGTRNAWIFDGRSLVTQGGAAAHDISASGLAVGNTWTADVSRATIWSGQAAQLLDAMDSYALGISDSGQVAGSGTHNGRTSAFLYADGKTTWIDAGVWASAYDVSNLGQAVGTMQDSRGRFSAFSWSQDKGFVDLGSLGGGQSWGQAVSDAGAIAGASISSSGYLHAFLYLGGMRDLGTLGGTTSSAYDVNNSGYAVGYSFDEEGRSRAFLWRDGMMFDLNQLIDPASGWTLEAAYGINDKGQIAGTGTRNGQQQSFLIDSGIGEDPREAPLAHSQPFLGPVTLSEVPEPGNLAAILIAGVTLGIRRVLKN